MDPDKIKAWWFNMVSELSGQVMMLTEENRRLKEHIEAETPAQKDNE